MIEEELQESDLKKPFQIIHTNTKISKQQASQLNLMKLVKQCEIQFQIASNFRECSQYLSELAIIYLKQHQFLKKNIETLQSSLIDQCEDQQENKEIKKKRKQSKLKEKCLESYDDDQPQFTIKDNPRNLIAAEKLQLVEKQRTPINMYALLKRNNQQQTEYEIDNVVMDLSQIQKCSLSDILNKKNQELKIKKKSNTLQQSKQQLVYNFNGQQSENNKDDDEFVEEVDYAENLDIEYQEAEQKQEISRETKKVSKKNTNKEDKLIKNRNRNSKMAQLKKTPELDIKIKEDTDELFKNNLQTFMRHKEKIHDLSLQVNFLQLEPEFWKHEDELIGLINKISFCQDSNQKKIQEEHNFLIFDNLTTETDHKKPKLQNQGQSSLSIQNISEFSNFECFSQTPSKNCEQEQENRLYQILIEDIQSTYGKHGRLSSNEFFQISEKYDCSKPKAFYNLLIFGRVGVLEIQNNQNQQCFSEIQIVL
ncbi:unnamed protein product (macronuclear) [Paramecium tetraurelia]|uniref:Rad21/Rec8-like protein C-terminal eukaryotic domain-containing protein n=1 Tax=Paramecium tetraurelia TaxID=5888 RepID=A0CS63_PARTE|nr:uncharacterized protein GSPATT00009902001 [Paramecium tetraurelia]CAK73630.1 unnamed protein product [Paramecium tetraurelia]|eukprot:XP_001441027.1 hypothetical protein (macronuclear) [Paramecium tetraurelia strain d4-2]